MTMRARVWSVVLGLSLAATFLVAWMGHDWIMREGPSPCAYRYVIGEECCFCGLTRSFAHVTHGEFADAQACNPGWWAAVVLVGGFAAAFVLAGIVGWNLVAALGRGWRRWWWAMMLLIVALTAARAL